jgi:molybdopterin-guanine dinucleotide biosynthesis protein A
MGAPKAMLEWHGSTLLYRAVALVTRAVDGPVVVVAAPGQTLPGLPAGAVIVEDAVEGLGPMCGIATGLAAVTDSAPAAFVCSTDMPFLHPAFVDRVTREMHTVDADVVLPFARGFRQPLAAAYRTGLADLIAELAADGVLRPGVLFEHCHVHRLDDADLLADRALSRWDPDLESVINLNSPDEYEAARARPPAEVTVQCFGPLASVGRRGPRAVRAATLGDAAMAVDVPLDQYVMAALNGDLMTRDPQLPLVAGDVVALLSADAGG